MTPITDRRAALAFVTQYASTVLSACSTECAASLANWILLNRTAMEPADLRAADDEYRAERADWPAGGDNLDKLLAPSHTYAFEDGVSRQVVLELLAQKVNRLQSSAQGPAILARMMTTVGSAAPAHALWTSGSSAEDEAMSDFFVAVQPHVARVPSYLLGKYRQGWLKLAAADLPHAQPQSIELTLRHLPLGDYRESQAVRNFIVMLGDPAHERHAYALQTQLMMKAVVAQTASAPSALNRAGFQGGSNS